MDKIPATPKELIAALQADGEIDHTRWQQFDELYRPVIPIFLHQKFGSRLGNHGEDVVQEVMIKLVTAFRNRQYDPAKGRFRRYLAAVAYNAAVNALRRLLPERAQDLATIDLDALPDPSSARAYDRLERQFQEAVYQRMTKLYFTRFSHDPTDREVWEAYRRGESSSATAQRLGKTPEAVRQQRKRILATLQSLSAE